MNSKQRHGVPKKPVHRKRAKTGAKRRFVKVQRQDKKESAEQQPPSSVNDQRSNITENAQISSSANDHEKEQTGHPDHEGTNIEGNGIARLFKRLLLFSLFFFPLFILLVFLGSRIELAAAGAMVVSFLLLKTWVQHDIIEELEYLMESKEGSSGIDKIDIKYHKIRADEDQEYIKKLVGSIDQMHTKSLQDSLKIIDLHGMLKQSQYQMQINNLQSEMKFNDLQWKSNDLQKIINELQTKNKELQTKNKELQTKNKELQTKNKELQDLQKGKKS